MENKKNPTITLAESNSAIQFFNHDGTRIELGYNDTKVIRVTTVNGLVNFEQIIETK